MYKQINEIYRSILTILLFLFLMTSFVNANAERSLEIKDVNIEAEIMNDASMNVTEKITVYFNGKWNGFYINIPQGNTTIKDIFVSENNQKYIFNSTSIYGLPGTYLIKKENDKVVIDWSINAENQLRTFQVNYKVLNVVKVYNDIAELYRKFIGDTNKQSIENVNIKIKLPKGSELYEYGNDIKIWGHGPLNGEIKFNDNNQVVLSNDNLNGNQYIEARIIMPTKLFNNAPKDVYINKNAFEDILSQEAKWSSEANKKRMTAKIELILSIVIVLISMIITYFLWTKYGKAYKTIFNGEYYRDLPASYSPAELSVLWNSNKFKAQDITATILDLARRKIIKIEEEIYEEKNIIWKNKLIKKYKVNILSENEVLLLQHEKFLLEYFKHNIALTDKTFYLEDIEKFSRKYKNKFYQFWVSWQDLVREETEKYNFFDAPSNMPVITIIFGLIIFIIGCIIVQNRVVAGFGLIISGAIIGLIPRLFKRYSITGREDFVKWKAFRKFLTDFSEMDKHEIPSLIIWEHYLVYAITLGVAEKVIKQLELIFPEMKDGEYKFGYGWYYYSDNNSFSDFNNSIDNIINSIENSVAIATKDNKSSESGAGGGFSSGGGGGSGGSSYGGR